MSFTAGNKDGKHYWLTPPEMMERFQHEFNFNFDACPFPKPENFDGLKDDWGSCTYVNPPFGSIIGEDGKKKGPTAWARKAIEEYKKGNKIVMVYPVDKWILMLLEHASEVRNLKDVKWCATEDGSPGKGIGRHVACFVLDPSKTKTENALIERMQTYLDYWADENPGSRYVRELSLEVDKYLAKACV